MHVINDFFLLVWNENAQQRYSFYGDIESFLQTSLEHNYEYFCDYCTLILVTNEQNFDNFSKIEEPLEAVGFFAGDDDWSEDNVKYLQKELLHFLNQKGNKKLNKDISKRFDLLRKEEIIGYENARNLISLLSLIKEKEGVEKSLHVDKAKEGENFFKNATNILLTAVENLQQIVVNNALKQKLEIIPKKIKDEKFSIGITGVMNAGKSTMLNALLGKEILGTSVIPETANLTVVKYAKKQKAIVNFWNKKEWENIEKSSLTLKNIKPFIDETKEHFGTKLQDFIQNESRQVEISIDELALYISAEHSDKKCNLVKSVDLYSDLKFVQNGVEIVDTPGLDDPVIQREEITKGYLYQCDLMIHLMNVNQSATNKDIEFIIDTLLYQNVARLLIVITRIDTVNENELNEVIEYTKTSIQKRLKSLQKDSMFNKIIEKIDFIPIAGKMALLHRICKAEEAEKIGYSLERSGILKIENYLDDILFGGNSQKANLIIDANKKEILHICQSEQKSLNIQKDLLGKSSREITHELEKYQEESKIVREKLETLKIELNNAKDDLVGYFPTLKKFAHDKMRYLEHITKLRVIEDVSYEIRKNKKKPEEERISYIIEMGIKDGLVDILRDYRFKFKQKMELLFERLSKDFENFLAQEYTMLDSKDFFESHFGDMNFVNSNAILITKCNDAIKKRSKKDLDGLDKDLIAYFEEAFSYLNEKFDEKTKKINFDLSEEFEKQCKSPIQLIEFDMTSKEEIIKEAQTNIQDKSFDNKKKIKNITQELMLINKVLLSLNELGENNE